MSIIYLLLYIYITAFTIYFLVLSVVSMKPLRKFRDRYTAKDLNLCVVLYASGDVPTLENLIKQLKEQSYPAKNYTIYTILDKCENVSEVALQSDLKVNVININNLEPVGKSQAYSIIAEKLRDVADLDAYVFLDGKNYVDSNFLTNVNFYLTKYSAFNPTVCYIENDNSTIFQKVQFVYSRYCNNFINLSRTRLGLTNIVNTDSFVIKKDLLNKISTFDFKDIMSEVNYTMKLANENIPIAQISDLKVYKSINSFEYRIPSLSKRLNLFWNNLIKPQNFLSREFALSFAYPNWLVCILGYFILLKHAYIFPFVIDYSTILITFIILIIAFCTSLMNTKFYLKEYLYLMLYPLLSMGRMIKNFPPIRGIRKMIQNTTRKHVIETMTTDVIVSDGVKEYHCKMELISDDGLAKVTFINKNKRYTTKNNHLRMIDAVRELNTKLADYGMSLKICQCCKYFTPLVDGSTNMVKGCCNCQFPGRVQGDIIPTLIWNTCPNFEVQNIVNLF